MISAKYPTKSKQFRRIKPKLIWFSKRGKLFGGTVPPNKTLFGGNILPNNTLFGGTVQPNSTLIGGTSDSEKYILFNEKFFPL